MNKHILNYTVREKSKKDYGGSAWKGSIMEVIYTDENGSIEVLGEYERNYPSYGIRTFAPFLLNEKHYALYSKNYTCTRIMELPSCKDIGGEPRDSNGFCPVDLWVPYECVLLNSKGTQVEKEIRYSTMSLIDTQDEDEENTSPKDSVNKSKEYFLASGYEFLLERSADFGFVAGCVWGDDSSWKLERFDLSKADQGVLTRNAPWGYLELPRNYVSLRKHVSLERGVYIGTKGQVDDRVDKQKMIDKALKDQFFFMEVETKKSIHLSGGEAKVFD